MCEGYACYPVFLNRTRRGVAKRDRCEEAKRPQETVLWLDPSTVSSSTPITTKQRKIVGSQQSETNNMALQPSNAVACETQLISTFWEHYMPSESVQTGCQCAWLQLVLSLQNPSHVLRQSLKAVAMARLGWIHQDDTLVLNGRVLYGQALHEVQKALYDNHTMWQDETLATGYVLALYEVSDSLWTFKLCTELSTTLQFCEPTNNSIAGWNSHTNGVTHLTLLRGPDRHRSSFGRALLEGIRLSAVCMT